MGEEAALRRLIREELDRAHFSREGTAGPQTNLRWLQYGSQKDLAGLTSDVIVDAEFEEDTIISLVLFPTISANQPSGTSPTGSTPPRLLSASYAVVEIGGGGFFFNQANPPASSLNAGAVSTLVPGADEAIWLDWSEGGVYTFYGSRIKVKAVSFNNSVQGPLTGAGAFKQARKFSAYVVEGAVGKQSSRATHTQLITNLLGGGAFTAIIPAYADSVTIYRSDNQQPLRVTMSLVAGGSLADAIVLVDLAAADPAPQNILLPRNATAVPGNGAALRTLNTDSLTLSNNGVNGINVVLVYSLKF